MSLICIQCVDECLAWDLRIGSFGYLCRGCLEVLSSEPGLLRRYIQERGWQHEIWV